METLTVELLAPAGNLACLHAAVRAGADAIYLGAESFNARHGADNFTIEDLAEACEYAHLRGRKVYLTVNTAILPGEIDDVLDLVRRAYLAGVDAYIVQDIGVAEAIGENLPGARLHISTQMNTHNVAGVRAAARLGAKRITLARELSLVEIAQLAEEAASLGMEVEAFAHGAICICYSGQCFMSSLVGGRSANRGMCAQACRLPYELLAGPSDEPLPAEGEHLLSPKDLMSIDYLPELVAAGAASLKIEGRMKSPEYVSAVIGAYRSALDRALAWARQAATEEEPSPPGPEARATEEEKRALSEAFSRGFTHAYLVGKNGNEMMSYGRPNNRGVQVGRVLEVAQGRVRISQERELHAGDVLEFWTKRGHFAHQLEAFERATDGSSIAFELAKRVGKGDRVFRVRSAEAAFEDDRFAPLVPVTGRISIRVGEPIRCSFATTEGVLGQVEGPIAEEARSKPLLAEEVRAHVARFGGTPFALDGLEVDLDGRAGAGFSLIHRVRADALEALQSQLLRPWAERSCEPFERIGLSPRPLARDGFSLQALAASPEVARVARKAGVDRILVDALHYKRGEAVAGRCIASDPAQAGYPRQCSYLLPTVDHDPIGKTGEARFGFAVGEFIKAGEPVIAENFGQVIRALEAGAEVEVGPHIPVLNARTARVFERMGVRRIWLSPELNLGQIQQLADGCAIPLGLIVAGQTEMMVTEHCLLMSQGPCDRRCDRCERRRVPHRLKDRKGYEMPVITDQVGRSHLYNAVPFDAIHVIGELIQAGVTAFMADCTLTEPSEARETLSRLRRALERALASGGSVPKREGATTGHLFRGIA